MHTDKSGAPREQTLLWGLGKILCRIAATTLFDMKSYGLKNVPRAGGALLVSNHQSHLDPILLAVHLARATSFLARSSLFDNAAFSWLIRQLNAFPVRRGEADVGAIKEAIRRLEEGRILVMFPEGTRSVDGSIGKIQPGIALLVRRAGVPVVPAVIDGACAAWPKGAKIFRPHPIRVMYGKPMDLAGMKGQQIVEKIDQTLRGMLEELRAKGR